MSLILLAILLLLLGLFGLVLWSYLFRETRVGEIRALSGDEDMLDPASELFSETLELFTNTQIYRGNRIELLINGDGTYPRLFDQLRRAERLITWFVFWYRQGDLAEQVKKVLCERAQAGVKVLFLYDWYGTDLPRDYFDSLRAAGVEVTPFRPPKLTTLFKIQQRMHVRAVTIDSRIGFTGGFSIDDNWKGSGRRKGEWRDTSVQVEGPIVDQLQAAFAMNWAEASKQLIIGQSLFDPSNQSRGHQEATLVHTAPSMGSTNADRLYALVIRSARHRIWFTTAYFVPENDFHSHLIEAARDGVDVRVLHPGANTDRTSTWYAARHQYEDLLSAGVRIFEYEPTMIHAKTFVVDGLWSSVGSINFDNRSMVLNDEITLLVRDREFGNELEDLFLEDLEYSREVSLEEFRRRSRLDRVKEAVAARIGNLL